MSGTCCSQFLIEHFFPRNVSSRSRTWQGITRALPGGHFSLTSLREFGVRQNGRKGKKCHHYATPCITTLACIHAYGILRMHNEYKCYYLHPGRKSTRSLGRNRVSDRPSTSVGHKVISLMSLTFRYNAATIKASALLIWLKYNKSTFYLSSQKHLSIHMFPGFFIFTSITSRFLFHPHSLFYCTESEINGIPYNRCNDMRIF